MTEIDSNEHGDSIQQLLSLVAELLDREPQTALSLVQQAKQRAVQAGETLLIPWTQLALGRCLATCGFFKQACLELAEARSVFIIHDEPVGAACCQYSEAIAQYFSGNYSTAREMFQTALRELESHQQFLEGGRCLYWMAILENFCHNTGRVEVYLEAARHMLLPLDAPTEHSVGVFIEGMLAARRTRYDDALGLFAKAATGFKQRGEVVLLARVYCEEAYALLAVERFEAAWQVAEQAREIFQAHQLAYRVAIVNELLGVIATSSNQFDVAYQLLGKAQDTFEATEMRGYVAQALLHRANLDYYLEVWSAAEARYHSAALAFRELGTNHLALLAESNLGFILGKQGRYDAALMYSEAALEQAIKLERDDDQARCHRQLAGLYTIIQNPVAAEDHYQQVLALWGRVGVPVSLARAQTEYAQFCRQQGRYAKAEQLLEAAHATFLQRKLWLYAADCQLQRARVALAQGNIVQAATFVDASVGFYESQQLPLAIARARHVQGDVARATGQPERASAFYEAALNVLVGPAPADAVALAAALADVARQANDLETVLLWQRKAVQSLQQARSRVPIESFASPIVHQYMPLLQEALSTALELEQPATALALAEDARTQVALAWIEGQRRDTPLDPAALQMAGRIRALRHKLNPMQEQLDSLEPEADAPHLLETFNTLQTQYNQALALWRRFGSEVIPGTPEMFDWYDCRDDICRHLTSWHALVYWLDDSSLIIWHCTPSGIRYFQQRLVRSQKFALNVCCSTEPEKRRFVYQSDAEETNGSEAKHLKIVADLLLPAAVVESFTPETPLIIVPAGVLHTLPFAALPLADGPLVTYVTPLIVPSLQILRRLLARPSSSAAQLLAIGVQHHSNREELRYACAEARFVAGQAEAAEVWCDDEATTERLQEASTSGELRQYRLIHLATHAWSNNLYAEQAGVALANADLSVTDVAHLKLNTDLVVLSACESALGKLYVGEEIVGLSYALLQAGSRAVLASLWQVGDEASLRMMRLFYEIRGEGKLGAWSLAATQRQAWHKGIPASEWAAYQWIGKPDG